MVGSPMVSMHPTPREYSGRDVPRMGEYPSEGDKSVVKVIFNDYLFSLFFVKDSQASA